MRKLTFILCLAFVSTSCKSSKHSKKSSTSSTTISSRSSLPELEDRHTRRHKSDFPEINEPDDRTANSKLAENIIDYAMKFEGVRYKYGGSDKRGMDCSGLGNHSI